jgi:hypothetical protein
LRRASSVCSRRWRCSARTACASARWWPTSAQSCRFVSLVGFHFRRSCAVPRGVAGMRCVCLAVRVRSALSGWLRGFVHALAVLGFRAAPSMLSSSMLPPLRVRAGPELDRGSRGVHSGSSKAQACGRGSNVTNSANWRIQVRCWVATSYQNAHRRQPRPATALALGFDLALGFALASPPPAAPAPAPAAPAPAAPALEPAPAPPQSLHAQAKP